MSQSDQSNSESDVNRPSPPTQGGTAITGIAYELGESERAYTELEGKDEAIARFGLIDDPSLWGWGMYRKTNRGASGLAVSSVAKTLQSSGVKPNDIDALIFCSVAFPPSVSEQTGYLNSVLDEFDLFDRPIFGLTLNQCTTMVGGVRLAGELVATRRYHDILVISCDIVSDESARFDRFAIFSDSAASCIVTSTVAADGYEIVHAGQVSARTVPGEVGGDLVATLNQRLLNSNGKDPRSLGKIFHDNLFIPIICMREQMGGFSRGQMYLENIAKTGHCFASDPLINLVDYTDKEPVMVGSYVGLFSGAPGIRAGAILRKR